MSQSPQQELLTCYDDPGLHSDEGVPSSVNDLFSLHYAYLDKLMAQEPDGGVKRLLEVRRLLGQVKIFSLFSGLGGAELCFQQIFNAVSKKCDEYNVDPPSMPHNLLSCDYDTACQKVLSQHHQRSDHIVDDMMRFLSPRCASAILSHYNMETSRHSSWLMAINGPLMANG